MNINIQVLCRKDKIKKDNTTPIFIRFTQNRKVRYISTGLFVSINQWDFENQSFIDNRPETQELQYHIDTVLREYDKKIKKLDALDIEVTLDTLLGARNYHPTPTLQECLKQEIARLESLGKYASASKHQSVVSLLNAFQKDAIRLDKLNLAYLQEFEAFLRQRGNQDNSIATKFSLMKAVYNKAVAQELFLPSSNPFSKFKVGRLWTTTQKRAITKNEMQKLMNFPIPPATTPYLAFAKDIFIFTYLTAGINFRDIATLQYTNVRNGRIYYTRHKTGKKITCQLMPQAQQIIQKYSKPQHEEQDYIFPILDRKIHRTALQQHNRIHKILAKVNLNLKELGKMAGIQTPLTTYVARHTYATVLKRAGVNIALISESLGHSDLSTTQIYLDSFENAQIDEAMKNLL